MTDPALLPDDPVVWLIPLAALGGALLATLRERRRRGWRRRNW